MEIEYDPKAPDILIGKYYDMIKTHTKSKKSCVVCRQKEPADVIWHSYQLPCGHYGNTR